MSRPFDPTAPLEPGITLLEASAGTGKTHNITDLVLRLLLEQRLAINEILIVTFTEAATEELRDRTRARLRQALAALRQAQSEHALPPRDPLLAHLVEACRARGSLAEDCAHLLRSLDGFDEAAISTIHGFCRRMLAHNAFESGAAFDDELVAHAGVTLRQLVADFWTRELHRADATLVQYYRDNGVGLGALTKLAREVTDHPQLQVVPPPPPERPTLPSGRRWSELSARARRLWGDEQEAALALLARAIDAPDARAPLHRASYSGDRLRRWQRGIQRWFDEAGPFEPLAEGFSALSSTRLRARTLKGRETPTHALFDCFAELVAEQESLGTDLAAHALAFKHRLVRYARRELPRRKRLRQLRTFDDLLRDLARALADPEQGPRLASVIRGRYRAALIDEFQDTDPVQWAIFRQLFEGQEDRWLFLIGDPKQAIYGFRGADVFVYLEARAHAARAFTLPTNWRSDGPLVEAMNHLFGGVERPFVDPGIGYHRVGAAWTEPRLRLRGEQGHTPITPLQFRLITRNGVEFAWAGRREQGIAKGWLRRELPRLVAADVAGLLNMPVEVHERNLWRPLHAGDIAILVRTHEDGRKLRAALTEVGIPTVLHSRDDVFQSEEATELLRVLGGVAEPSDRRAVRAALATDLLGLSAAELLALQEDDEGWELWQGRLRRWHERWVQRGFIHMFRALMDELGMAERLLSWVDGERRVTNLLHLVELAHQAASEEQLRPQGLLSWIERQRLQRSEEDARQLRLDSDAAAVQLITIHGAKGLQYPVVWCPYLWDGALLRKSEESLLRYHEPGQGHAPRLDIGGGGDASHKAHRALARAERLAESLRLAYVALTRARHLVVIHWGWINQGEGSALAWLLHRDPELLSHPSRAAERFRQRSDDQLLAEVQRLVRRAGGTISVGRVHPPSFKRNRQRQWARHHQKALDPRLLARLRSRTWQRAQPLDPLWRRTSFSALTHGPAPHLVVRDLDEAQLPPMEAPGEDEDRIPLADFPRGAATGLMLHRILERCDFDPESPRLVALVMEELSGMGLDVATWRDPLLSCLRTTLTHRLPGGWRLAELPPAARFPELDFDLPILGGFTADRAGPTLTADALATLLARWPMTGMPGHYPDQVRTLGFRGVRGFLTGSIDLVCRARGRWYLIDYKSNHLGEGVGGYQEERLGPVMASHHYYLQALFYSVGLVRYLRFRMEDFDYDRDFGGALYLFLRGLPCGAGVWSDRPPRELVEGLDALLRGDS